MTHTIHAINLLGNVGIISDEKINSKLKIATYIRGKSQIATKKRPLRQTETSQQRAKKIRNTTWQVAKQQITKHVLVLSGKKIVCPGSCYNRSTWSVIHVNIVRVRSMTDLGTKRTSHASCFCTTTRVWGSLRSARKCARTKHAVDAKSFKLRIQMSHIIIQNCRVRRAQTGPCYWFLD